MALTHITRTHYFTQLKDIPDTQWEMLKSAVGLAFKWLTEDKPEVKLCERACAYPIDDATLLFKEAAGKPTIEFIGDNPDGEVLPLFCLPQKLEGQPDLVCATEGFPFDFFVMAVLILADNLCKGCLWITSNATSEDWQPALDWLNGRSGMKYELPRNLLDAETAREAQKLIAPKRDDSLPRFCNIEEIGDLFVESLIVDDESDLIFMSVFGRDTAVTELLARASLSATDANSLTKITVWGSWGAKRVFLDHGRLDKKTARIPGTRFGIICHAFLFQKDLGKADYKQQRAFQLYRQSDMNIQDKAWRLTQNLVRFPLPDHWREDAMAIAARVCPMKKMRAVMGDIGCYEHSIDSQKMEFELSEGIREGRLKAYPEATCLN
jgi:hypothetical protein